MKEREKLLAIVIGGLLVLIMLGYGYGAVSDMFSSRQAQLKHLTDEVTAKEGKLNRGAAAPRKIKAWQEQSLPADAEFARTEYQNWLVGVADKVHLSGAEVETSRVSARQ